MDWAERLAMLRREVLENSTDDDSTDSEPSSSASAWGWNPDSSTSESVTGEANVEDDEAGVRLAEDDSVAARLQSFTSRDQRSHQQITSDAWNRSSSSDNASETPTDAPGTTEVSSGPWWKNGADDSLTESTQSAWRSLSDPQPFANNEIAGGGEPDDHQDSPADQERELQNKLDGHLQVRRPTLTMNRSVHWLSN